jgi:hypothetical protein
MDHAIAPTWNKNAMTPLERLLALEDIKQLKARYFRCLDEKDWDGFEAVFTPDASIDASEVMTPLDASGVPICVDGLEPPARDRRWTYASAKSFADDMRVQTQGVITVHHGHMPEIRFISATTASGIWAMEDKVLWPKGLDLRELHGYGHYREIYERQASGWRIKKLKLTRVRVDLTKGVNDRARSG